MPDALERLKVLLNSSTPIVVMETVEEMRAVNLVRIACSAVNLATFEWSIASGSGALRQRRGRAGPGDQTPAPRATISPAPRAIYNSKEPAQALSNLEGDVGRSGVCPQRLSSSHGRSGRSAAVARRRPEIFRQPPHRHYHRACDHYPRGTGAASSNSWNSRLPDKLRLRQIIDETSVRVGKTRTLKRTLDARRPRRHGQQSARPD